MQQQILTMSGRYSPTERIGVNAVERIVIQELGWIFREQPIVDVGVDAIIEQCENGNPTGKFIAVQIKSGGSSFHITDSRLIYYASHIHYHYWLNINIPIILIAYLPNVNQAYWQHISEANFKKSKLRWKIEIPKRLIFDRSSKGKLFNIFIAGCKKDIFCGRHDKNVDYDSIFDIMEDIDCIYRSINCIRGINAIMAEMTHRSELFNQKIMEYRKNGLTDRNQQVLAAIKGFARDLNLCAKRIENEIILFSELCFKGFKAYKYLIIIGEILNMDKKLIAESISTILSTPRSLEIATESIKNLRHISSELPSKYDAIKESKKNFLEVLDLVVLEYSEAENIIECKIQLKE